MTLTTFSPNLLNNNGKFEYIIQNPQPKGTELKYKQRTAYTTRGSGAVFELVYEYPEKYIKDLSVNIKN